MGQYDIYSLDTLDKNLFENDPQPSYASEYIAFIGEMFLGNLIDFTCKDEEKSLYHSFSSVLVAWKHIKENFFIHIEIIYMIAKWIAKSHGKTLWIGIHGILMLCAPLRVMTILTTS